MFLNFLDDSRKLYCQRNAGSAKIKISNLSNMTLLAEFLVGNITVRNKLSAGCTAEIETIDTQRVYGN